MWLAIVTGVPQGIGESIARYLAGAGATVVLTDVKELEVEAAARAIVDEGGAAICPGNTTASGQQTSTGPGFPPQVIAKFAPPLGCTGIPKDIANAVLVAVNAASSNMTGQTIVVDGGARTC